MASSGTIETPPQNSKDVTTQDFLDNTTDLVGLEGISSRYEWVPITEKLWSSSFPYQLAVLTVDKERGYSVYENTLFTFPINPEDLSTAMPFASTVEATLGGVVEQHGGMPFRQIAFSGTFGVLPARPSATPLSHREAVPGILGGTIQQVQGVRSSAQQVTDRPEFSPNLITEAPQHGTGYYQYRQFQRFLESYAEAKRTDAGQDLRLALIIWKEQAAYLVTPRGAQVRRSKDSPHEFRYNLQLQAWKRIDPASIGRGPGANAWLRQSKPRDATWAREVLGRLDAARKVLAAAKRTVLAIRSDYDDTAGQALRQTALFLRDTVGLVKTALDFPSQMRDHIARDGEQWWDSVAATARSITEPHQRAIVRDINSRIAAKRSGARPTDEQDPLGLRAVMADPDNDWLHELVRPDSLALRPATREMLAQETDVAAALTKSDFKDMQRHALAFAADFADRVGLGSTTYNRSMGFPTAQQVREAVDEDYDILAALNDTARAFGQMAGFGQDFQPRTPTTIEYVAGIAQAAGIDMRVPRSKFAVPFPYQGTLDRLAQQYLGDATRWFEIAALNDLRAPYIDEDGVTTSILVNGRGNEVVVANAEDLVLGQSADLLSTTHVERRVVLNTQKVAPGYWVVTLNGAADLDRYLVAEQAQLQFFQQHTVHGGQVIYIPSAEAATLQTPYAPTAQDLTRLLQAGDVDGLLTEDGDVALQPNGDWPFVYGLQSIIQWTRTAISTPLGSMVLHPEFGFPLEVGQSVADLSAEDMVKGLQAMFKHGPAFTDLLAVAVDRQGPVSRVSFELGIRGLEARIPISFNLPR